MAFFSISNVSVKGISACVPKTSEENSDLSLFKGDDGSKFIASTGIERRRIVDKNTTTSDLCYCAAEKLITELQWDKNDVDCLVFVTQTPDYILPATSCILQDRLGLNKECYTLDVSLGCSGWIYGMSVISSLLNTGGFRKGLLLVGDTISKYNSSVDKSTWPLFGDAGTATALIYDSEANKIAFHMATDGKGYDAIIVPDGGSRNGISEKSLEYETIEEGITRNKMQIILNGMDVFTFGISKAPQSVKKLLEYVSKQTEDIDYFLFHQANQFMNEKIRKKLDVPENKVPYSLKNFGNTSCASIPLTMVTQLTQPLQNKFLNLVGCGFGVGLSWGSIYFSTNEIVCPDLIEM